MATAYIKKPGIRMISAATPPSVNKSVEMVKRSSLILAMLLVLAVSSALAEPSKAEVRRRIKTCLNNCAQCQKEYGSEYFLGYMCARDCVATKGTVIPDCNVFETVKAYFVGITV